MLYEIYSSVVDNRGAQKVFQFFNSLLRFSKMLSRFTDYLWLIGWSFFYSVFYAILKNSKLLLSVSSCSSSYSAYKSFFFFNWISSFWSVQVYCLVLLYWVCSWLLNWYENSAKYRIVILRSNQKRTGTAWI